MIVKKVLKNGDIKIYEYDKEKYDQDKYYKKYKDLKGGYAQCENCGSKVLGLYIDKHKATKKCQTFNDK